MKKLFTLLVVIFVFLFGCVGLNLNRSDTHVVKFGPNAYTMPSAVPDFTLWQGGIDPIFMSPQLSLVRWLGFNPKNADECVIVLIVGENQKRAYFVVLAYTPSVIGKKQSFYADKQYLLTGKPSFILSLVPEAPDISEFIVMKQLQLAPKVEL